MHRTRPDPTSDALKMSYEAKKRAVPYMKSIEELPDMRRETVDLFPLWLLLTEEIVWLTVLSPLYVLSDHNLADLPYCAGIYSAMIYSLPTTRENICI